MKQNQTNELVYYKVSCKWKDGNTKDCSYNRKACIKSNVLQDISIGKSYNCHIVYYIDWIKYVILKNDITIIDRIKYEEFQDVKIHVGCILPFN